MGRLFDFENLHYKNMEFELSEIGIEKAIKDIDKSEKMVF